MTRNKWYFLKIQLILGTTPTSQDTVNILLESSDEFSKEIKDSYVTSNVIQFNRASIMISVGVSFTS